MGDLTFNELLLDNFLWYILPLMWISLPVFISQFYVLRNQKVEGAPRLPKELLNLDVLVQDLKKPVKLLNLSRTGIAFEVTDKRDQMALPHSSSIQITISNPHESVSSTTRATLMQHRKFAKKNQWAFQFEKAFTQEELLSVVGDLKLPESEEQILENFQSKAS